MPSRKILISTVWLRSSLVVLAMFVFAPSRTMGLVANPAQPTPTIQRLSSPSQHPTPQFSTAISHEGVILVDALRSENDEQDLADPLDEPRISFLNPRTFPNDSERQLVVPRSILSHYPLRC